MSTSTENFIKTIYLLERKQTADTKPGSVARLLGISSAAATDMSRKLAKRKLIKYEKYQKLRLTDDGVKLATDVIRKHRLWEAFLYYTFNMSLHEIHREAELLEHQTSDFLADKISEYLGNPQFDPHGDPIPDSSGKLAISNDIVLSHAKSGTIYEVTRLFSSDKEFFDFCKNNTITVGSAIRVEKQYPNNKMTEITIDNIKLLLNSDFSNIIYVKRADNHT
jgi:DtxR family Mn-dependent transcriptional regulator